MPEYDAVIVGSGPNGLAAAIELARAGWSVAVFEAKPTIGGGARTLELTEPGYLHDICSAIHPLGMGSPFFRSLPLEKYGLQWIQPNLPLAHPFDDGSAAELIQSLSVQNDSLGQDAAAYRRLMQPFADNWDKLAGDILAPFRIPKHPFLFAHFGLFALQPALLLAKTWFKGPQTRA